MKSSDSRWLWLAFYTWRKRVEEANMQVALMRRVFKRWASYVAAHAARRRDLQARGEEWLALRVMHWVVRWRVWAKQGGCCHFCGTDFFWHSFLFPLLNFSHTHTCLLTYILPLACHLFPPP